jgi:hypothetical protein
MLQEYLQHDSLLVECLEPYFTFYRQIVTLKVSLKGLSRTATKQFLDEGTASVP